MEGIDRRVLFRLNRGRENEPAFILGSEDILIEFFLKVRSVLQVLCRISRVPVDIDGPSRSAVLKVQIDRIRVR